MTVPPRPTPESIAAAREAQARERAEVERLTGLRILADGRIVDQKEQRCES
jgi:hypothetical protein